MAKKTGKRETAGRPQQARKSRKQADPSSGTRESVDPLKGATGRELAATVPGRNPHTGAEQGALLQHPPGSNGGVHRGPDLRPRVNVQAGTWMKALMAEGPVLVLTRKGQKVKLQIARGPNKVASMVENIATRLQAIVLVGSDEDFLRAVGMMGQAFPQPKNGKNGHNEGPIMPNFVRAEEPPAPAEPPTPSTPGAIEVGGQEYVG